MGGVDGTAPMGKSRSGVGLLVIAAVLGTVGVAACGAGASEQNLTYGENARSSYLAAMEDFDGDNCTDAEPEFRRIKREFSYSRYAALAELRIADCLEKQDKFPEAIQAFQQFVRQRPSHTEVPYARFKVAECYFKQIPEDFFLAPPAEERDQGPTREALEEIRRFLLDFPDDHRVAEAREMAQRALALLARHELYVARFYLDRDHPDAAIMRLEGLLNSYRGSGIEPEALLLLGRTYLNTREQTKARRAFEELVHRYPRSGLLAQAREFLAEMGPAPAASRAASPASHAPAPAPEEPAATGD